LLTGAFHEDAFADTFDALGGGWTREQILEIMKDSRLGTYGTLALGVGIGIRAACFVELANQNWVWALSSIVAASTLGRLAIVGMMVTTNPIPDRRSQARDVSGMQSWRTFCFGLVMTIPFWIGWLWLGRIQAVVAVLFAILMLLGYRRLILQRVGGTTGDLLGCSAYLAQLVVLIGSSWSPQ
jgi:adenosylcobinamide-GDP ribazoletransferase